MEEKKKSRFIIEEGDVKIAGKHQPTEEEKKEAVEVFGKILKNRKPKK
ncbi:hypothetical protein [Methanocella arvoryzae]|nr:hypothetical protein [Methanocella arvoryzae]